jgi:hypothetical protein
VQQEKVAFAHAEALMTVPEFARMFLILQFLQSMWIDGSMMLCRFKSQLSDFTNSGSEPTVWGHASTGGNASSGTTLPFARICCRKWMRCSSIAAETAIIVPWIPWV